LRFFLSALLSLFLCCRQVRVTLAPNFAVDPRRIFQPARKRLTDARASTESVRSAHEAWRILAEKSIIPSDWLDDDDRRFIAVQDDGLRIGNNLSKRPPALPTPSTVRAAVTIASDVEGVLAAEDHARTCVASLGVWGGLQPRRICWDVALRTGPSSLFVGGPPRLDIVGEAAAAAVKATDPTKWEDWGSALWTAVASHLQDVLVPHVSIGFRHYLVGAAWWRKACDLDLALLPAPTHLSEDDLADACESDWWVPEVLVGRPIRSLPNPFESLLAIWSRGYALCDVDENELVLAAAEA
jgi:hypothetical protein